jgi:integrase/recombinase XerC
MSLFRLESRGGRWYADLSKWGGPSLKAMIPDGERRATRDPDVAQDLYTRWKKFYLDYQRREHLGLTKMMPLGKLAREYIEARAMGRTRLTRPIKAKTLEAYAWDLENVLIPFFKPNTPVGAIDEDRIDAYIEARRSTISKKTGRRITDGTIQRELCVLSSLFQYAIRRKLVFQNPVREAGWLKRPEKNEVFLEVDEAWRFLEAARQDVYPYARPFVGMMLYCGLRLREALGLEARDVDPRAGVVHVRNNRFRTFEGGGIKYRSSIRTVPLWPDLREWLPPRVGRAPLFPTPGNDDKPLSHNVQKMFNRLARKAGIEKHVTPHVLRHTWCAMRLQTLDGGAPVSLFTVMREGGWSSLRMVERIYGHLPQQRLRLNELSYRPPVIEQAASS